MKLFKPATGLILLTLTLATSRSWSCGETTTTTIFGLPTLGGSEFSINAMNSAGQLAGFSNTAGNAEQHAILFDSGGLTDLGTLGGFSSIATAINSSGQVAGESGLLNFFEMHALLYSGGSLVDLGTLGGSLSVATAINDAGQIAGYSLGSGDATLEAFLYDSGTMTGLGTLGGDYSSAIAINQAGTIAGDAATDGFENHAFLYANGSMLDVGTLGGDYSSAFALNNVGTLVGESSLANGDTHAFAYADGVLLDLGTLGGTESTALGVNGSNQIIGTAATTGDAQTHAFLYANGVMTDLGTLGGNSSEPNAINNLGEVVGQSKTASATFHAFIYRNGTMTDLNTLLPDNSGWVLSNARFINDSDRIVGQGTHNGSAAWFVMDLSAGGDDHAPVAVAGSDLTVECQSTVNLNASQSSDPDSDALSFEWSENGVVLGTNSTFAGLLGLGSHTITLKVSDPCGMFSQDEVLVTVVDTTAPTVACPPGLTATVITNCQAIVPNILLQVVASDNCAPAGSLTLSQNPAAGTTIGLGQHTITVTATDSSGNSSSCSTTLNVVDAAAPVITSAPASLTAAVIADCQALVPNVVNSVVVSDNCTATADLIITQSPAAGSAAGLGQLPITVTVMDAAGNSTSTNVTLTVVDSTAPVVTTVSASPDTLSPPNHQIVPVTVSVVASDNCDPSPVSEITSVTCSEPVAAGDIQITGALTVNLAASKSSSGAARVYTITVRCTDASGNSSTGTVNVTVPKSNGNGNGNKNKP
ncbi:MAG: HYR domain-containing protein [Verrucomicrobia bacterium]|nr:MAG: HYR domain-containing protein [Verrucomicrobiota bacterium]